MNIQQEVGHVKKGVGQKVNKDEYPTGGGPRQKRGGSESQQKMNIQQEVGHVKKGVGQKVNKR